MTGVPAASKRASKSMRSTTCSSEPGGIVRTSTTSARERSKPSVVIVSPEGSTCD